MGNLQTSFQQPQSVPCQMNITFDPVELQGMSTTQRTGAIRHLASLLMQAAGIATVTNALVLCVDEKSQCQALERIQPMLPMGLGYVEGVTHDYVRHGTTTLFAALNAATGEVIAQCEPRHRHQEFIAFLNHIDRAVPANLDVHPVVDNYAAISIRRSKRGWPDGLAITCTSRRRTRPG